MFCSNCGAKLPDHAKFCHACGARGGVCFGQPADGQTVTFWRTA